ncbi:MAG TPA: TadE/TadG family type IV pilus assembly protein, partial [Acidobacteriaceae bacterium]|nr:TadE/TadG family type IV pilus assembly protein [Acidobacteriaceae bacterium]
MLRPFQIPWFQRFRRTDGQSLLETAVFLPILILLIAYAVDFGYFFIVAANLTSSARNAAEYSVLGYVTPGQLSLASAGPITDTTTIAGLAVGDLSSLASSSTTTTVEVCSKEIGVTNNVTQ